MFWACIMAATALAGAGARILFLGADAPVDDIVLAATAQDVQAVALSAAHGSDVSSVRSAVRRLRKGLPNHVAIIGGGRGFPNRCAGVDRIVTLQEAPAWLQTLRPGRRCR